MARAQGARALMALAFETTYGTPPTSGFRLARGPRRVRRLGSIARPRRRTIRRERGGVFFLFQQQALRDVGQLEGLEDRPDVEQRVDGLGAGIDRLAVRIADALPGEHCAARKRLGEGHGAFLVRSVVWHRLNGGVAAGRHHERGGQRARGHASAGRWSGRASASIGLHIVYEGGGAHPPDGAVAGGLPVEDGLHALRPGNLDAGARQVDGVHGDVREAAEVAGHARRLAFP